MGIPHNSYGQKKHGTDYLVSYGPIQKAIEKTALYNEVESGSNISQDAALTYIIDRLNILENNLLYNRDKGGMECRTILIRFYEEISNDSKEEISKYIRNLTIDFKRKSQINRIVDAYWNGDKTYCLHVEGNYY